MFTRNESIGAAVPSECEQRFDISLDVEEIHRFAGVRPAFRLAATCHHTCQHGFLLERWQLTDKAQPCFEQAHTRLLAIEVVLQRLHQSRPKRGAHCRHICGNRVGQFQWFHARAEQLKELGVDEAVSDRFLITTSHQQTTQQRQLCARFRLRLRRETSLRVPHRQAIIAV